MNDWKKLTTTTAYENKWIKVDHHEVINPSGNQGIYGQVNFKNIALGIVALDEELNTWLVGQYRFTLDEYSWEIPEGGCPHDEDTLQGAKRELKEETGIIAKTWTPLGRIHTSNSVTNEVGFMFLAEDLSFRDAEPEETENLTLRKISLQEVIDMIMNGEITDSISIAALLKVARLKLQNG